MPRATGHEDMCALWFRMCVKLCRTLETKSKFLVQGLLTATKIGTFVGMIFYGTIFHEQFLVRVQGVELINVLLYDVVHDLNEPVNGESADQKGNIYMEPISAEGLISES